jgi:hypothetical protein
MLYMYISIDHLLWLWSKTGLDGWRRGGESSCKWHEGDREAYVKTQVYDPTPKPAGSSYQNSTQFECFFGTFYWFCVKSSS